MTIDAHDVAGIFEQFVYSSGFVLHLKRNYDDIKKK